MYRLQHYLTPKFLKQVYYSVAYPHVQYAISSWGMAPATYKLSIKLKFSKIDLFVSCPKPITKKSNFLLCLAN